jgi:ryanodine receptor 2
MKDMNIKQWIDRMKTPYIPRPLDTGKIELSAGLRELTELLARNTHEVWAQQRLAEGWRYGATRNDAKKEHPCLVAYEDLPENEKEYDRNTAMETLKVIKSLGFRIEK